MQLHLAPSRLWLLAVLALALLGLVGGDQQHVRSLQLHAATFIPTVPSEADPLAGRQARLMDVPAGTILEQSAERPVVATAPQPSVLKASMGMAPVVTTLPPSKVAADESAATEAGDVIEERRWLMHLRAYCSASFAGGLTVGIVGTLLVLSLGSDRAGKAEAKPGLERASSSAPDAGPTDVASSRPRNDTESLESIHRFGPRCGFLVGMLLVQSLSSLMLAGFQDLIQSHPSIVFFLTMVVGTGGNVGGQSVVLAVRRLAYGEEVSLSEQVSVGVQLSAVLAPLALLRAYAQGTKPLVCLTIGLATLLIVVLAAALGTALPKLLHRIRVDPAHATPVIQVLMDMVGVLTTCVIGYVVLDVMMKPVSH